MCLRVSSTAIGTFEAMTASQCTSAFIWPLFVGAFLVLCPSLAGQNRSYSVTHFGTEQGLSDHRVTHVLEHSNGFVYVGTWNGLNRFDGYQFEPVQLTPRQYRTAATTGALTYGVRELEDGRILVLFDGLSGGNAPADIIDPNTGISELVDYTWPQLGGHSIQ